MKKLVLAIAMALSCVLPAFTATAHAAEAPAANKALDDAVKYYNKSFCDGLFKAFEVRNNAQVPDAKKAQIEKLSLDFSKKTLIPCLNRNGISADWIKVQSDPEIRKLNDKTLQAKTFQEMQPIFVELYQYMQKKYPDLILKMSKDQEYIKGFHEMTRTAQQILLAK